MAPTEKPTHPNPTQSKIASVGAFAVCGGNLTELPSSPTPLPAGATPASIAVS